MSNVIERRAALELRASGNAKSPKLEGYASVFNSVSEDLGGFREIVKPGAFQRTLRSNTADPLALVAHIPSLVLGRRSAGTLKLAEDSKGLAFEIDLPQTMAAADLLVSVERGDIKGASFAFVVPAGGDAWKMQGDTVLRELHDVSLHEISITANPAYADTTVARRSLEQFTTTGPRLRSLRRFLETI
jgi:Escherichia/Staphylococcus phage prohead protease